jgi:hypothetical protein
MQIKMYRYVLLDSKGNEIMGTDVDEPEPQIDSEFWNRFMQGDCVMRFQYNYIEEIDDGTNE